MPVANQGFDSPILLLVARHPDRLMNDRFSETFRNTASRSYASSFTTDQIDNAPSLAPRSPPETGTHRAIDGREPCRRVKSRPRATFHSSSCQQEAVVVIPRVLRDPGFKTHVTNMAG